MTTAFKIDPVEYAEQALQEAARQLYGHFDYLWFYRDQAGVPIYAKIRQNKPDGKVIRPVSIDENGTPQKAEPKLPGPKPLYNLHLLSQRPDEPVWIVEGEKCADRLNAFLRDQNVPGVAVTSGSSTSAAKTDWSALDGRVVTIWPDNDAPGIRYASAVATVLKARCHVTKVGAEMLGLEPGGDVADYLEQNPRTTYQDMVGDLHITTVSNPKAPPPGDQDERPARKTDAQKIIELASECCTFFHDENREAYAIMTVKEHREIWPVESRGFEDWIYGTYYRKHNAVPAEASFQNAKRALCGQAKFEGDLAQVHLRVAKLGDAYWIDLCNDTWQAVKISAQGWEVVDKPAVYFIRTQSMRPLPIPAKNGDVGKLWEIVNISPDDQLIALAWMLECFRPDTAYPVLELTGTQGSAKSTTQRYLREFIDPNKSNLRAAPKNVEDVFIAGRNAHLVSLENLSHLSRDYQDALCTLATGGGYAGRTLFTNGEETVFDLRRPIALNGIAVVVTAQDLSDRTVHFDLPEILEGRCTEVQVEQLFASSRESIFGGLLDAFAAALEVLPEIKSEGHKLPRMADFALLGESVFRSHGKPAGSFLTLYNNVRRESVHRTLEGSPVAMAIQAFINEHPGHNKMLVKHWLASLDRYKPPYADKTWPQTPRGFADAVRRIKPAMKMIGVNINFLSQRTREGNLLEISTEPQEAERQHSASPSGA